MAGVVYLVQKGDLYLIGRTSRLERKMKKIGPDKIIATLETDYPLAFEARLLRRYRHSRLPDSSYFDFSEEQVSTCKKQFSTKGNIPRTLGEEFYIALSASVLLFFIVLILIILLGVGITTSFSFSFLLSSIPMFFLFFVGNFGGYHCSDLDVFSSWLIRLRALFSALILLSSSYIIWSKLVIH